jgi:hypothetical protein
MATTTIDQPATATTGARARPGRARTLGKVLALVVTIGVGAALLAALVIGLVVVFLDSASS